MSKISIKKNSWLLVLCSVIYFLSISSCKAQGSGYYYKYDFEDFLESKVTDRLNYLRHVFKHTNYPSVDRNNEIEGYIRAIIINHGLGNNELIVPSNIGTLDETVKKVLSEANNLYLKESSEKYFTEVCFNFDIEPLEKRPKSLDTISISVFQRKH